MSRDQPICNVKGKIVGNVSTVHLDLTSHNLVALVGNAEEKTRIWGVILIEEVVVVVEIGKKNCLSV